jgi:hypothetical protein
MSGPETSTMSHHTREAWTKATATIRDINEGADFAKKVLEMFAIVVELLNKMLIFPTKLSTQKQEFVESQFEEDSPWLIVTGWKPNKSGPLLRY